MKSNPKNKSLTVLMASNYTYGPPMLSPEKKQWVENELKHNIKRLEDGGFDVRCLIDCAQLNEDGDLKFNQADWDKIFRFEFLDTLEQSQLAKRDDEGKFHLTKSRQDSFDSIHPCYLDLFKELFPDGKTTFDAREETNFYEHDLDKRVRHFVEVAEDPKQLIIFNNGGGSIGEKYMPQRLSHVMQEKFHPTPTVVFGFSDGTYVPFYFADKAPNITLVQASNIFDLEYLRGERDVRIKLKKVDGSALPSQDIDGDVLAISIHTSYGQIFDTGCVKRDVFAGKIVMLESARDSKLMDKITTMIDSGAFDNSKAIVLGEFPVNASDQQKFYQEFAEKLNARRVDIPVLQSADGPSVFGHGSKRGDYIACGKCKITTEGDYIGENAVLTATTKRESFVERLGLHGLERDNSFVERIRSDPTKGISKGGSYEL